MGMPRQRKTAKDRRLEAFTRSYKVGKAKTGFQEPHIAQSLGISVRSLQRDKKSLNKISTEQFITLGELFDWSDEEFLAIIRQK